MLGQEDFHLSLQDTACEFAENGACSRGCGENRKKLCDDFHEKTQKLDTKNHVFLLKLGFAFAMEKNLCYKRRKVRFVRVKGKTKVEYDAGTPPLHV